MVNQLSIFIQNRLGHLAEITEVLKSGDIDIRAITVTEGHEFGILRIVANDTYKAQHLLEDEGYLCNVSKVLAIEPEDRTGIMAEIFRALAEAGVSIEYIYSIIRPKHGSLPAVILKTDDQQKAAAVIRELGIAFISEDELCSLD